MKFSFIHLFLLHSLKVEQVMILEQNFPCLNGDGGGSPLTKRTMVVMMVYHLFQVKDLEIEGKSSV